MAHPYILLTFLEVSILTTNNFEDEKKEKKNRPR